MDGGVSQVDSFDPKTRLDDENGQDPRAKFKVDATQFGDVGKILKSPWTFKQYGESGMHVSELFPHIATCVDDLALIRSMTSNFPEHTNANYFLHTGSGLQGRPSMGMLSRMYCLNRFNKITSCFYQEHYFTGLFFAAY